MNEVFEKILELIEQNALKNRDSISFFNACGINFISASKAKEIVQEVEREYNGGWISCSERLPEEAFGCLITVMDCEPSTQTDFKNILPCFVGYDGETWNDADGNVIPFEVIAWMPLPQPYQYAIGKTDSSKMRSQNKS